MRRIAMKLGLLAILYVLCSIDAQATTVTGTVVDGDGTAWANGTIIVTYQQVPGWPGQLINSANGQPLANTVSGSLDGSGTFSVTVVPTAQVYGPNFARGPIPGVTIQICPAMLRAPCSLTSTVVISGTSQNVSSVVNAAVKVPRISGVAPLAQAYNDTEVVVQPGQANLYFNLTTGTLRCYASNAWASCAGAAGTVGPGTTGQFPYYASNGTTLTATSLVMLNGGFLVTPHSAFGPNAVIDDPTYWGNTVLDVAQINAGADPSANSIGPASLITWAPTVTITNPSADAGEGVAGALVINLDGQSATTWTGNGYGGQFIGENASTTISAGIPGGGVFGVEAIGRNDSTGNIYHVTGINSVAQNLGSGTVDRVFGSISTTESYGGASSYLVDYWADTAAIHGGTATNVYGFYAVPTPPATDAGTITNFANFIGDPIAAATGTGHIHNAYGLYLGAVTGGDTLNYQLYSNGTAPSAFGGVLEAIGSTSVSGCSLTTALGGKWAGSFHSGTTGTCTVTVTPGVTAPNGFSCWASDLTTPADIVKQTATSQTTATLAGTTASGDVVTWGCVGY